jgi:hypothetical protein
MTGRRFKAEIPAQDDSTLLLYAPRDGFPTIARFGRAAAKPSL